MRQASTNSNQQPEKRPHENPSTPGFSLQSLGATRTVKVVVYTAIGIIGTMETIFWTKAGWRYFYPEEKEQDKAAQNLQS